MSDEPGDEFKPMSIKEALALLSSLHSSQAIPALRHADFVMLAGLAFQGFRMDAGGYANPIVRRRLAEEAAKNGHFASKLRELSKLPVPSAPVAVAKSTTTTHSPAAPSHDIEKFRVERDRLKHERDAAISAKTAAERQLIEHKRSLIAANSAQMESDHEIERLKQRLDRLERKQRQLETTNAALRRAAVQPPPASVAAPTRESPIIPSANTQKEPFVEAIRHLLTKDRESVALSLVNDVLRAAPEDVNALEIKADALIKSERFREASAALRSAITLHLKHSDVNHAAANLTKLLIVSPQPDQETKLIREFMAALVRALGNPGKLAEPLNSLRIDSPVAFALVKSLMPPSVLHQTFAEPSTYAPEAVLPLALSAAGLVVTPRGLVTAIDRNDQPIVELTQEALRQLDGDVREKILKSVTAAADGDAAYARVLTPKFSRGAVVVDSSNVAWHGQEVVAQQPRVEYILAIRRTLREKGYFPVLLVADANLPYVINDTATVRKMVDDEQIQLVVGGSDADEQILREANRLDAPVVTNDYMADWDPDQSVIKIQYSFTPDGRPTIYF